MGHKLTILSCLILASGAAGLRAQSTNAVGPTGNVGVGTTSPNAQLEIYRSVGAGPSPSALRLSTGFSGGNAVELNPFIAGISNGGFEVTVAGSRRLVIDVNGNVGLGTGAPSCGLDVAGVVRAGGGILNTSNYFDKVLPSVAFPNMVANQAVDLRLGNLSFWGYIEVEITSTFSYQNSSGKLTKVFAVGVNPGNYIYTNESRVSDAMGAIPDNISIGALAWDETNATYKIPISHIVSTQNSYTIKVRMLSDASGASLVFSAMTMSNLYTLNPLPRNYVYFNDNVGIGTAYPTEKLSVNGRVRAKEVIVESTGWSDYVFEENYVLQPLSTVETQIRRDGHLPGIPSAKDIAESGVSIGAMQAKLLAKIEELTLHQIEQEKHIRAQDEKIASLQAQLSGPVPRP